MNLLKHLQIFTIFLPFVISLSMPSKFKSQIEYLNNLEKISSLPKGFSIGTTRFSFKPFEVDKNLFMNLTVIKLDKPTESFSAMFTKNEFPGAPVIVGKDRMKNSKLLQAVVINNKISNVCPGGVKDSGVGDAEEICQKVSDTLKLSSKSLIFPSSTGVIGWRLPVEAIKSAIPGISYQSNSALPAANGITTTDRYPKVRSAVSSKNKWKIVAIAKGAGMIEPNMATMLCYVMTDLKIKREKLDQMLKSAVSKSFNTISIDGDQSTSDTVLALSSNEYEASEEDEREFQSCLNEICSNLSEDIVRNGEGTQHVIKVKVTGAPSDIFARDLGRFVCNSNLIKCAVNGNDPNVGRIVGAVGSFLGNQIDGSKYTKGLVIRLNEKKIFDSGSFALNNDVENFLSDAMQEAQLFPNSVPESERNYPPHFLSVNIDIALNYDSLSQGSCCVIGSDLSKEYVEVNADYRS